MVIGGGFIGLEIAATAAKADKQVTVIEMQGRLLPRVLTDVMSETILQRHRSAGVDIRLNTALTGFDAVGERIAAVEIEPGGKIGADLVITGIGAHANMELAANAGLATSNGIDVDSYCRTSSPDVFAIGDCAFAPSHYMPGSVRLESVQNALDQGRAVAMTIAGAPTAYTDVPWFWSDQFDLKLQMAGLHGDSDQTVLRGDPESGRYSLGFLRDGRLTAMHSVNQPADHVAARHLVGRKLPVQAEQIADTDIKLKQLLKSTD